MQRANVKCAGNEDGTILSRHLHKQEAYRRRRVGSRHGASMLVEACCAIEPDQRGVALDPYSESNMMIRFAYLVLPLNAGTDSRCASRKEKWISAAAFIVRANNGGGDALASKMSADQPFGSAQVLREYQVMR